MANCGDPDYGPKHLQSFALATDQVGLQALLPTLRCYTDKVDAIKHGETALTQSVRDAGYDAVPLYSAYADGGRSSKSKSDFWESCEHNDIFYAEQYFGMDVHPFDTIFTKVWRGDRGTTPLSPLGMKALDQLTKWAAESGFSSYDQC